MKNDETKPEWFTNDENGLKEIEALGWKLESNGYHLFWRGPKQEVVALPWWMEQVIECERKEAHLAAVNQCRHAIGLPSLKKLPA